MIRGDTNSFLQTTDIAKYPTTAPIDANVAYVSVTIASAAAAVLLIVHQQQLQHVQQ